MCGIAGIIDPKGVLPLGDLVGAMADTLRHRGPDGSGQWVDEAAGVALAHRRLAVIDLSPAGRQPMISACGRYVLIFNGEIYNHGEVRREIEAFADPPPWRGHTDTEVLLEGFARFGVERTLQKAVGMFALALWDRRARCLSLCRDRVGEKPLYYGWVDGTFTFASELKAFAVLPGWQRRLSLPALALYLRYGYVPAPYSIYQGIFKQTPGTLLSLPLDRLHEQTGAAAYAPLAETSYWNLLSVIDQGRREPFAGSREEAAAHLEELLRHTIGEQMVADVPVGAFLSGGVDSSTVVALMQRLSPRPVRTFSIGFADPAYDESPYARSVAAQLGTAHSELRMTAADVCSLVPEIAGLYDEPFADPSLIPTCIVSRLARREVTVSLSGDGGDELFGGYARYRMVAQLWAVESRLPLTLRQKTAQVIAALSDDVMETLCGWAGPLLRRRGRSSGVADHLHKLMRVLPAHSASHLNWLLLSAHDPPATLLPGVEEPHTLHDGRQALPANRHLVEQLMCLDTQTYLPDDILVKVDRAAMGISLETRIPFLDHRVIEFAWCLPFSYKCVRGVSKWPLHRILQHTLPEVSFARPKKGFALPLGEWLRGPLRDWADNLLAEGQLRQDGIIEPGVIATRWREHRAGQRNWHAFLWRIIVFRLWQQRWLKDPGAGADGKDDFPGGGG